MHLLCPLCAAFLAAAASSETYNHIAPPEQVRNVVASRQLDRGNYQVQFMAGRGVAKAGGGGVADDDDDEESGHDHHHELIGHKIGALFVMLAVSAGAAALPIFLNQKKWFQRIFRPISVFACGAFIGLAIFHLMPEATYNALESNLGFSVGHNWYNGCYLLVFAGFLLILFAENILSTAFLKEGEELVGGCAHALEHKHSSKIEGAGSAAHHHHHHHDHHHEDPVGVVSGVVSTALGSESSDRSVVLVDTAAAAATTPAPDDDVCARAHHKHLSESERIHQQLHRDDMSHDQCHTESEDPQVPGVAFSMPVLFGVLALAIHSVFEGIVLGLMEDKITPWFGSLAIIGHKVPVAVSLSVSCIRHHLTRGASLVYMSIFVLSTPIGVAIGTGVAHSAATVSAIFSGLSAGVLLYTGCEATFQEFGSWKRGQLRTQFIHFACFILGAGMVLGMMMLHLASGSHDHSLAHAEQPPAGEALVGNVLFDALYRR